MHLAERGYAAVLLTALLAIAGVWSSAPAIAIAWYWPALLLLGGLTLEGWLLARTKIRADIEIAPRALLGHEQAAAFEFHNASPRDIEIQYIARLPPGFEPHLRARHVKTPRRGTGRDGLTLLPVRLGEQHWQALPARILGRFALAWWPRELPIQRTTCIVPDCNRPTWRA